MRKLIITLTVILAAMTAAKAQPRAVGISVGPYEAVTFQHMVYGTDDFFQLDLGYQVGSPMPGSMRLAATYNMILMQPDWFGGEWNFYVGYCTVNVFPKKRFEMRRIHLPKEIYTFCRPGVGPFTKGGLMKPQIISVVCCRLQTKSFKMFGWNFLRGSPN